MTNTHQRRQFALEVQPQHPVTPDGRYFVVHGSSSREKVGPRTDEGTQRGPVSQAPRRAGRGSGRPSRCTVKRELGERGPVWWTDRAPDLKGLRT